MATDQVAANRRRSALLVAGFATVVAATACLFSLLIGGGALGVVLALAVAGALTAVAYQRADAVVLAMSHVRPADPVEHARLHNLVEGLCIASGLPKPRVYVVDDNAMNAFATGRDPRHASVAVTTGLLDKLNRIELEGVLAHELTHVKNYDILVSTLAVTMVGLPLSLLPPLAARVMQATVSGRREAVADVTAVSLTRYPPGLASALEKLRDHDTAVQSASRATAHLWIESPVAPGAAAGRVTGLGRVFGTRPPLEERIQALREL